MFRHSPSRRTARYGFFNGVLALPRCFEPPLVVFDEPRVAGDVSRIPLFQLEKGFLRSSEIVEVEPIA